METFEGTLVEMDFGSHLYGLATPKSDKDYMGVYMPSLEDVIMKRDQNTINLTPQTKEKNGPDDVDRKFYSLWKFIDGCKKGNTDILDMLHAPHSAIHYSTKAWDMIVANRHKAYTKSMNSFVGYLRNQANRYGIRGSRLAAVRKTLKFCDSVRDKETLLGDWGQFLPVGEFLNFETTNHPSTGEQHFYVVCNRKFQDTIPVSQFEESMKKLLNKYGQRAMKSEENDGVDWKAISHALRVGYQTRSLFTKGTYTFPLDETDFILNAKTGKLKIDEVRTELDTLTEEVETLAQVSAFPENTDKIFWDNLYQKIAFEVYGIAAK